MLTADQLVADATAEATAAANGLEDLEERVRADDPDVSPEQLEKARGLKRFTQLRREAAERKAAAAQRAAVEAAKQQALTTAREQLDGCDVEDLVVKYLAAKHALEDLVDACRERNQAIRQAAGQLLPHVYGDPLVHAAYDGSTTGGRVELDGRAYRVLDSLPGEVVGRLVYEVANADTRGLEVPHGRSLAYELRVQHGAPSTRCAVARRAQELAARNDRSA